MLWLKDICCRIIVGGFNAKDFARVNLLLSYSDYRQFQLGGGECPATLYSFL